MNTPRARGLRRIACTAAVAGLVAAACTSDSKPTASSGFRSLRSAPVALQSDRSCDAVLEDFQAFAPEVMVDRFFGFGFDEVSRDVATMDDAAEMSAADGAAPAAAPAPTSGDTTGATTQESATSETNTQEEGIDEPDVVETDGEHVYVVDGTELIVLDGANADVLGRLELGAWGSQILLQGDRILAISNEGYGYAAAGGVAIDDVAIDVAVPVAPPGAAEEVEPDIEPDPDPVPPETEPRPMPSEPPSFHAGTILQLVDVSDPASPTVVETTEIEGNHISTRVVGGVARVVVSSYPQPQPMMAMPAVDFSDVEETTAALSEQADATTIEDWLPSFRTTVTGAEPVEGTMVACESVFVPEVNAGVAETSVLRVDFEDGFDPADTTTIVAETGTVYASATTLYLAANRWVSQGDRRFGGNDDFRTALHAFDLSGDGAAAHLGAGDIPGHVLNQYSLSEFDGHLRVATTEGAPWDETDPSQSGVRVLRLIGEDLTEVGRVTGLGVTETIQSVRFMGPVGYVVTFRQTDPLYVIDLSDPTDPRAVGELKIPGFSSYLHPAGPGRLIGIGRDADSQGRDQGFQVSLFDVSEPTAPEQIQVWTERDAWSQAGFDPKAFLYWAPETALAIPYERYGSRVVESRPAPEPETGFGDGETDEGFTGDTADDAASFEQDYAVGILVLDIADDGIAERALVTHDGRYPSRALVVQGSLWSLFDGGVAVSAFGDLASPSFHDWR